MMTEKVKQQHMFSNKMIAGILIPVVLEQLLNSIMGTADTMMVSNIGSAAISAVSLVDSINILVIQAFSALAAGGAIVCSQYIGQQNKKMANESARQVLFIITAISIAVSVLCLGFKKPLLRLIFGSVEADVMRASETYFFYTAISFPFIAAYDSAASIFRAQENTKGPMLISMISNAMNIVGNAIMIWIFHMGVAGAALATGIGQCIPAIAGLVFFMFSKGELRFTGFKLSLRELGHACYNGSSEMVSELSNSVVTVLFNLVLMRLAGEAGVAAISILLYGQFLFNAFYLGFTIGISPIVGFQYGAKDKKKLRSIYKIAFLFVAVSAVILTVIAEVLATWIITVFTHDPATFELAEVGFKIFAVNFLFSGLNITSSGFFTALSNGKVSAIISFSRTFIFTVLSLLILPHFLKIYGAWLAVPIAEAVTLLVTVPFHKVYFIGKGEKNYLRG